MSDEPVVEDVNEAETESEDSTSPEPIEEVEGTGAEEDASTPSPSELEELQAKYDALLEEMKPLKEAEIRAMAELENFKRRKEQEKAEFVKFSNEKMIMDILPVLDAFDMALLQADSSNEDSGKALLDGMQLIKKQLDSFLERHNVSRIEALNQDFDPNLHQALKKETKDGAEPNKVILEMQAGYRLNDRVIRPTMAVVSE